MLTIKISAGLTPAIRNFYDSVGSRTGLKGSTLT